MYKEKKVVHVVHGNRSGRASLFAFLLAFSMTASSLYTCAAAAPGVEGESKGNGPGEAAELNRMINEMLQDGPYAEGEAVAVIRAAGAEGDSVKAKFVDGKKNLEIDTDVLSSKPLKGVIAMCIFEDGSLDFEYMSKEQLEKVRQQSKAKNSLAWGTFTEEMYKKVVIRRLCKRITLDLDSDIAKEFDSGIEIETDQRELARRDIEANENSEDFIESTAEVVSG